MATKFRINRGEWIDVPEDCVLLKESASIRRGDLCYRLGKFVPETIVENWMRIGDFRLYDGVIRKKENLHPADYYFEDGSVVEAFNNPQRRHPPYTILRLASPDYEEQDRLRALAEEVDPRFDNYKVEVQFRPKPRGGSYAALFMSGADTMSDRFDAEEEFSVEKGYTADYFILDENENEIANGELRAGRYRFHNSFVEQRKGLDWIKLNDFRKD